jgi:hypothetical protein
MYITQSPNSFFPNSIRERENLGGFSGQLWLFKEEKSADACGLCVQNKQLQVYINHTLVY